MVNIVIGQYFAFAVKWLLKRRLRSWLTILGIFIGIATVVSLIALGQGVKIVVEEQFAQLGTDKLLISPGAGFTSSFAQGSSILTEDDLDVVRKTKGIEIAGGMVYKVSSVEYKNQLKYTWITGIPVDDSARVIEDMQSLKIKEGRMLEKGDTYTAVIGILLSKENEFFKKPVSVGDRIKIGNAYFKVSGIMDTIGNPQDDSQILIPIEQARDIFNSKKALDMIIAKVQAGDSPDKVAESVKKELRRSRHLKEGDEDFTVQTTAQLMSSFNIILTAVQFVLIGIAAISLIVGGIGIMNTMYTSVLERTRDIGVMKAIGAKNSDILLLFILESGLLGLVGGIIGILFGIAISKLVERFATIALQTNMLVPHFSPQLLVGALLFSFLIGTASGLIPSMQASRMSVIDSIRYRL